MSGRVSVASDRPRSSRSSRASIVLRASINPYHGFGLELAVGHQGAVEAVEPEWMGMRERRAIRMIKKIRRGSNLGAGVGRGSGEWRVR
jgi:hypothetical protein